jgi:hypothetical protein
MGLRFDLHSANWLARVLDERTPIPDVGEFGHMTLAFFLDSLRRDRFYSSPYRMDEYESLLDRSRRLLHEGGSDIEVVRTLRQFLGNRPWTALFVPSGINDSVDSLLCSPDLLRQVVRIRPEDPGLVLQLDGPPEQVFSLTNVFPAFKTALAASTEWPGVLIWNLGGDAIFLPVSSVWPGIAMTQVNWVFDRLARGRTPDLAELKAAYLEEFPDVRSSSSSRITILHLSDIHLGCREAGMRLPRVEAVLADMVNDLDDSGETVIPLISGDLMDTPDEDNLDRVRSFLSFISRLGTERPVILLGNHDVRHDGILAESLRSAMQISGRTDSVAWFEDHNLGIACFDSVRGGKLARGRIGQRQFLDMGSALDSKCRRETDYTVIAAVHHHPIPVKIPEWYAKPFYERIFGGAFDRTDELEDAADFISFVEGRGCAAVLHGHKHIPRIDFTPKGVPVIGCGSTVGKVSTQDKRPFMSINLVTINKSNRQISARLLAERIAGGGFNELKSHELVWSPQRASIYRSAP